MNVPRRLQSQDTDGSDWVSTPPPPPPRPKARVMPSFKVGDKVCIELPEMDLKEKQRGHGGWSLRMKEVIYANIHCLVNNAVFKPFDR